MPPRDRDDRRDTRSSGGRSAASIPRGTQSGVPRRHGGAVDRRLEVGAAERDDASRHRTSSAGPISDASSAAAPSSLPTSRFASAQRGAVHRAADRNAFALMSDAAEVLHGGLEPARHDANRHVRAGQCSNSRAEIGTKRTRSPVASSVGWLAGDVEDLERRAADQVPAARATRADRRRSAVRRCRRCPRERRCAATSGAASRARAGRPPRYAKPGMNPTMYTR